MMNDYIITLKDILKKREVDVSYDFCDETLKVIAQEFDLQEIKNFRANLKLTPTVNQKGIIVSGKLTAFVIHHCVVTLGPVPQSVNETIIVHYTPDGDDDILSNVSDKKLAKINIADDYDIEVMVDEQVNLYDIILEYFSLALCPTPRVANAQFDGFTIGELTETEKHHISKNLDLISQGKQPVSQNNPFASLAALKQKIED